MQITTTQPIIHDPIIKWLLDRNISYEQLTIKGIRVESNRIVIPVRDAQGQFIFNKYRRSPFSEEGPKYTYDSGTTASLFNVHTIAGIRGESIFITEGELDAVLLNSFGLNAVSTTGGSGSFKEEWASYFEGNDVYICYDKDEAGVRGALRVQEILPTARIIFFPEKFKGKDITDFFQKHTLKEFEALVKEATTWLLPQDISVIPEEKKEINKIVKDIKSYLDLYGNLRRDYNQEGKNTTHLDILLEKLNNRYSVWSRIQKRDTNKFIGGSNSSIEKAKSVPITNYLKFNSAGFTKCIWHSEDSPSLKYFKKDNRVYCFGCNKGGDTIDVVMKNNGCDVKEAMDLILGRT
jgi:DNA primase